MWRSAEMIVFLPKGKCSLTPFLAPWVVGKKLKIDAKLVVLPVWAFFWILAWGKKTWILLFGSVLYWVFEILAHFYSLHNNCLFWFIYISITLCHFLHSLPTPTGTSIDNFLSCKWSLGLHGPSPSPTAQMGKWYRLGNVTEHSCHLIINSKTFLLFYTSYHISCWPQTLWRPSSWRCLESKEADACWCICYTLWKTGMWWR